MARGQRTEGGPSHAVARSYALRPSPALSRASVALRDLPVPGSPCAHEDSHPFATRNTLSKKEKRCKPLRDLSQTTLTNSRTKEETNALYRTVVTCPKVAVFVVRAGPVPRWAPRVGRLAMHCSWRARACAGRAPPRWRLARTRPRPTGAGPARVGLARVPLSLARYLALVVPALNYQKLLACPLPVN